MTQFSDLGLRPRLLERLAELKFDTPTPIQQQAIPPMMQGRDVMGLAQTGTGKTAAFGLPLLDAIYEKQGRLEPRSVRALILTPTRELAKQITDNLESFSAGSHLRIRTVVGGMSINTQVRRLEKGADVLVATPGRLIDLMERRAVDLSTTTYLVLDEADQMLDMGFIQPLRRIAKSLPAQRQTVLFSATMPKAMAELAATFLRDAVRVQVSPPGKAADNITQSVHFVPKAMKLDLLKDHLAAHKGELALVFARTKHGAERMSKQLTAAGFPADSIHGNKSQGQRDRALKSFRTGQTKVLVATDVAARGIDIPDVRHVYNFDLPNVAENYIHRIGRTARAGAEGQAIAYCAPDEMGEFRAIEKVLGRPIVIASGEAWAEEVKKPARRGGGGGGGGGAGRPSNAGPRSRRSGPPRRSRKAA